MRSIFDWRSLDELKMLVRIQQIEEMWGDPSLSPEEVAALEQEQADLEQQYENGGDGEIVLLS